MKRTIFFLLLPFSLAASAQKQDKLDLLLAAKYNSTIYDRTVSTNSGGIGIGAEVVIKTESFFRPVIQIDHNLFFGKKLQYATPDGRLIPSKSDVSTLFGGVRFNFTPYVFASFTAGTAIYNGGEHLGIRPAIGVAFFRPRNLFLLTSFTNVFQRDAVGNQDFGYMGLALVLKLF